MPAGPPVVAKDTLEVVLDPGTAAAGYIGGDCLGSGSLREEITGVKDSVGTSLVLVCLVYLIDRVSWSERLS